MPLGLGFLKGLKLLRTAKTVRTVSTVSKVSRVSKIGLALKELPVVKIVAGSAVGIAAYSWWQKSTASVSEVLGISEENSSILIVVVIAIVLALLVSALRRR